MFTFQLTRNIIESTHPNVLDCRCHNFLVTGEEGVHQILDKSPDKIVEYIINGSHNCP